MLALAALAFAATPATATHVRCGDTVTADTTLDSDLIDCPSNGVQVDGDDITLDLGGHVIDGTGRGLGIVTFGGADRTVVTGGRLSGFLHAIALGGATGSVVHDVELTGNHDGILLTGGDGFVVERVLAWANDGSAINAFRTSHLLARDNWMVGNAAAVSGFGGTANRYERNLAGWNLFHGMRFAGLADSVLAANRLPGNGVIGIRLEDEAVGNVLDANRVERTSGDGISLAADSGANRFDRNRSLRNDGDGFDVAGPGAKLVRNRADRNGGLGFDAPLGVALDFRNTARHNGDPRECVGVDCGPR
jgi:hypothetical protein